MKTNIIVIFMVFFLSIIPLVFPQSTPFNQTVSDAKLYAWSASNSSGLQTENVIFPVGSYNSGQSRAFFQWSIPENIIPDGATITSAKIEFDYSQTTGPTYYHFSFAKVNEDITTTSVSTLYSSASDYFDGGTSGTYHYESTDSKLANWVSSSLSNNRFAIKIYLNTEQTQPTYKYNINSWTVKLTVTVAPQTITADQTFENGSRVQYGGTTSQVGHYETSTFAYYTVPKQFTFNINASETMKADTNLWTNSGTGNQEKYRMWSTDNNVVNYKAFTILPNLSALTSQFTKSNNATIQSQLIDGGNPGSIQFSDPWLIDNTDSKGKLNRGSNAIFRTVDYTSNNIGLGNAWFKGVFLDQTIASGIYYSVNAPSQSINGYSGYFLNWNSTNATIQSATSASTGVVFTSTGATVTANYKAQLGTSVNTGIVNGSQRKILRTGDGTLHTVYESAGKVWYEKKISGESWELVGSNDVAGSEAKSPSIASRGNNVIILYQKKNGSNYDIEYKMFTYLGIAQTPVVLASSLGVYTDDAQPVVASNPTGKAFFAWKQTASAGTAGIYYSAGIVSSTGEYSQSVSGLMSNTDANSSTPSVAVGSTTDGSSWYHYPFVWTQGSAINYRDIQYRNNGTWQQYTGGGSSTISTGSGYTHNYNPSVVCYGATSVRTAWIGKRYEEEEEGGMGKAQIGPGEWVYRVVYNSQDAPSTFDIFGENVNSVNINKNNNGSSDVNHVVAWSSNNSTEAHCRNSAGQMGEFKSSGFLINGKDVQLSNGSSYTDMKGFLLDGSTSAPYRLKLSDNDISQVSKQQFAAVNNGREGVVRDSSAEFYFAIGDAMVDDVSIEFDGNPDTIKTYSQSLLNATLESKPFTISNNSNFVYSVQYGTTDSAFASTVLVDGKTVNFKVQLVDDQTNGVIGEFDNITFSAFNINQYNNIGYEVNTDGIGNKTVRLRLVVNAYPEVRYTLSNRYSKESVINLGKNESQRTKTGFKGSLEIKDYALSQNFPNPFNPTTTINYALPKDGNVVLKVYDILGKEIATLVNDFKETGRYTVEFDASKLSTGMYVYKLTSDKFTEVKKMMLVK